MDSWKFQIMQQLEDMAGILEYVGKETRKSKMYAEWGEELQQLHLMLGTPDSEKSVWKPTVGLVSVSFELLLKPNYLQYGTVTINGSKTVTVNAGSVTRSLSVTNWFCILFEL